MIKTFANKAQLEKAAKSGDPAALYIQGKEYMEHQAWLKAKDKFWKAAENGHALSMLELGRLKGSKNGGYDYSVAEEWCKKAFDSGEKEVYYQLGLMYLMEDGLKFDVFKGISMLSLAKDNGVSEAAVILSIINDNREIIQLIPQNDSEATFKLAKKLYENSNYNKDCFDLSIFLLKKAASLQSGKACMMLGNIFYNGSDKIDRNIVTAKQWFEKALSFGSNEASERLSHYRNHTTIQLADSFATIFNGNFYYNCYNSLQAAALTGSISCLPFNEINEIRVKKGQNECSIITNSKTIDFSFAHDVNDSSDHRECNKFLDAIKDDFIFVRTEKKATGKVLNGIFNVLAHIFVALVRGNDGGWRHEYQRYEY